MCSQAPSNDLQTLQSVFSFVKPFHLYIKPGQVINLLNDLLESVDVIGKLDPKAIPKNNQTNPQRNSIYENISTTDEEAKYKIAMVREAAIFISHKFLPFQKLVHIARITPKNKNNPTIPNR